MPTYDYACTHCDHSFEVFQAFTDDALTECPECSGRLRKVFGSVGVVFKGSGFYRNDSRGTPSSVTGGSSGESKSSDSKSGDSKSNDSKSNDSKSNDSKSSQSAGSSGGPSSAGKSTSGSGKDSAA